jgi:hypothetical protein
MVKEQLREVDITNVISHVQFSPFSSEEMVKQATIPVINTYLYLPDSAHKPCHFGVLDHRMVGVLTLLFKVENFIKFTIYDSKRALAKRTRNATRVVKSWPLAPAISVISIWNCPFFMLDIFALASTSFKLFAKSDIQLK